MRILFFTSIERAFYSSIIEHQHFEPLSKIKRFNISVLAFIPVTFYITRGEIKRSFSLYKANRQRIKSHLNKRGIRIVFLPILFPLRHYDHYLKIPQLFLYLITTVPIFVLLARRVDLIHARNYPAGLLARISGKKYIFDPRDIYPEKGIEAGIFGKSEIRMTKSENKKSWSYRLWKYLEKEIIKKASYVITTSPIFSDYIKTSFHTDKITVIPNCVNLNIFHPDKEKRELLRKKYSLEHRFVLIHSGAFGTKKDIEFTGQYFKRFKGFKDDSLLLILCGTKKYIPIIHKKLRNIGIEKADFLVLNPHKDEVPSLITIADAGLHLETKALATQYCISVKDGEYLGSGIPMIVTTYLESISIVLKKYNAGIAVTGGEPDYKNEEYFLSNYERLKENALKLARDYLSSEQIPIKLNEIYGKLSA